jgi:tetratricopeptide (TPR) repeat protein
MNKKWLSVLSAAMVLLIISCKNSENNSNKKNGKNVDIEYSESLISDISLLKSNPDSNGLRMKIALAMDSVGDYKNALSQMDSLIKRDSSNYAFYFTKARISQDNQDTTQAIHNYKKAIAIYPAPESILFLANLLAERKDSSCLKMTKNVKSMRLSASDNANCDFISGVYYARTKDSSNALKYFNSALNLNYTLMPAYIEKGLVYFDNRDYRKALNTFSFASQVDHLYADAYYYMARSYEMMGIKDSAVLRFKQTLSLDKNAVEAEDGLKRLNAQ